jgi:3-methyl-2-oxobutanoate hydroxymethyltransferase
MSTRPRETHRSEGQPKTTVLTWGEKHRRGEPLSVLTAYDYPTAQAVDEAGVDGILVGDSLAMVVLGMPNTLSLTMDEMLHHARAVSRGARRTLLIGDMPFMSYQAELPDAVRNAGRFLAEGGMDAVKLEGGTAYAETARAIVRAGIPVMGHIGLTPQSLNLLGGFRVQGRTASAAQALLEDALALESAGCFSIVLEGVPERVAGFITERLTIPTIGIGAGSKTSGQVLVLHDLLGLFNTFTPKFAKRYAELGAAIRVAVEAFSREVREGTFPDREHAYSIPEAEWESFLSIVGPRYPKPALPRPRGG